MRRGFLLLFLSCVTSALRSGKHCFNGCDFTLNYVSFNDTSPKLSKKIRTCRSVLHAKSLYLCADVYCEEEGREEWLLGLNETCRETVNEVVPPWSVIDDYTSDDVARVRRLRAEEGMWDSENLPLGEVVIPDQAFFERAFRTLDYAWFEVDTHLAYGLAMLWFWGIVVSTGICWRLASLIEGIRRQGWQLIPPTDTDVEGSGGPKNGHRTGLPYALLKRFIFTPATFGYRCSQNIGWCTIPPRIQSLTILSFVLINVLLCCISYPVFEGNLYWSAVSTQYWRYISDRTGVLALANFPLVWLFGTRNNVLMWLTGWGFGTYNNFHRWVARVATLQAIVHSIGYTEMVFERGSWSLFMKYLSKSYFWNGEIATVLMTALSVFSVYGLRRSHYEIFLVTHIVLSALVLLTTFYHVEIFNGEWNIFIWPCLLVWIFDRAVRGLRILAFDRKLWNTKATLSYDSASNLARLEIPCGNSILEPQPGSYYYIYALSNPLFMHQNHPFTLAYISHDKSSTHNTNSATWPSHRSASPLRRPSPRRTPSPEYESLLPAGSTPPCSPQIRNSSLIFLIRPYSGFTSRLRSLAQPYPRTLRVLVEGPYGAPMISSTLPTFPSLLFIAGGTGIAVAISYLSALLSDTASSHSTTVESVHVVWAVREHHMLSHILERDIPVEILRDERVRITVHVTQDAELKDDIAAHGEEVDVCAGSVGAVGSSSMVKNVHDVKLRAGRPDVGAAVKEAADEVGREGRIGVVACGPATMADDARRACVQALGRGWRGVEYFEESFKW